MSYDYMINVSPKYFVLSNFEPVKYKGEIYGKEIIFNHKKNYIKLTSKFHEPAYVHYAQIEEMVVREINKKWLLWVGVFTIPLIIGIMLLFARVFLPPWLIIVKLKKNKKPLRIRARLSWEEVFEFINQCEPFFKTTPMFRSKIAKNKEVDS